MSVMFSQMKLPGGKEAYTWEHLTTAARDGAWLLRPDRPDKTVEVFGTFGASASVAVQAYGDGSTGVGMTDRDGTLIGATAAAVLTLVENPYGIRPYLSDGDSETDITVRVVC